MTPTESGLQFVVLHHTGYGDAHFDLMLEVSSRDPLITFRSPIWPITHTVQLTQLGEHRREYLSYEGPLSGGRGQVRRVAAGTYALSGDGVNIGITFQSGADHVPIRISDSGLCTPVPSGLGA
jgi:hypothetical protein